MKAALSPRQIRTLTERMAHEAQYCSHMSLVPELCEDDRKRWAARETIVRDAVARLERVDGERETVG